MKIKKILSLILSFIVLVSLIACGHGTVPESEVDSATMISAQEITAETESSDIVYQDLGMCTCIWDPIELVTLTSFEDGTTEAEFITQMDELLHEKSKEKMVLDIHLNGELGSDREQIWQVRTGDCDIFVGQINSLIEYFPELADSDWFTMLSNCDADTIHHLLMEDTDIHKELVQDLNARELEPLGFIQNASYYHPDSDASVIIPDCILISINKYEFDSLKPEYQTALRQAVDEAIEEMQEKL